VHVINSASRDTWLEVMARNHDKGYIKRSALGLCKKVFAAFGGKNLFTQPLRDLHH
jgi:hypothetical protein